MQYPGRFTLKVLITGFITRKKKKKSPHMDSAHILCSGFAHFKTITLTKVKQENPDTDTPKGRAGHFGDVIPPLH